MQKLIELFSAGLWRHIGVQRRHLAISCGVTVASETSARLVFTTVRLALRSRKKATPLACVKSIIAGALVSTTARACSEDLGVVRGVIAAGGVARAIGSSESA